MSFPISPTNGQTAIVNEINYIYSSADNTWTIVPDSLLIDLEYAFAQANASFNHANAAFITANTAVTASGTFNPFLLAGM